MRCAAGGWGVPLILEYQKSGVAPALCCAGVVRQVIKDAIRERKDAIRERKDAIRERRGVIPAPDRVRGFSTRDP